MIASLASGNGSLSDPDALRKDGVQRELPGLSSAPSGRRAGEFLSRLTKWDVESLQGVSRHLSRCVAPEVVSHELEEKGCVPVFVDGTGIEVSGRLFEHAATVRGGARLLAARGDAPAHRLRLGTADAHARSPAPFPTTPRTPDRASPKRIESAKDSCEQSLNH